MTKKIAIILAALSMITLSVTSCSSKDDSEQPSEAISADAGADAGLDETGGEGELAAEDLGSGELSEDALSEAPAEGATASDEMTLAEEPANEQKTEPTQEIIPPAETTPSEQPPTTAEVAPTQELVPMEPLPPAASFSSEPSTSEETPKPVVALQKIATEPWTVGKTIYNAVYIAREGDTLSSISQMIYAADKTAELKKGNPTYKKRDVKPGDKIYYNSPTRPTDTEKILTYYEDMGMTSEVYVAKSGDNIRKVAKQLLGYDNAWKEIWSTNPSVESKGSLDEGTELRYWVGAAKTSTAQVPPPAELPPPSAEASAPQELPPPPMEMTPPPPMEAQAEIPPPPPPQELTPPPPPPPPDMVAKPAAGAEEGGSLLDDEMVLGGIVLVAGAAALFLIMRRRRRQSFEESFDQTNVG